MFAPFGKYLRDATGIHNELPPPPPDVNVTSHAYSQYASEIAVTTTLQLLYLRLDVVAWISHDCWLDRSMCQCAAGSTNG
jgi:hypothetical protein